MLINYGIDVRCVRLKPYRLDARLLVDVQQVIPLPEAAEFQVQVREKALKERQARTSNADFTRFNVAIESNHYPSQWKRNAIFLICKHLCNAGIEPEEISSLFGWRPNHVWYRVDGIADSSNFEELALQKQAQGGQRFDRGKRFCGADDLVQWNGRTYAFSNQWGGEPWHKAMNLLKETYPRFEIDFSPVS